MNDILDTDQIEILLRGRKNNIKPLTLKQKKDKLWATVRRLPEVMVKVSGGGKTPQHVLAHLTYITRNGKLQAITDQGDMINNKKEIKELMEDWDFDIADGIGKKRQAFNVVLSMPKGTNADKLFEAAKDFATEEFGGRHQYVMALHTDTAHPHAHLVVKAEGFDGKRLHIRKADLQEWRELFAEKLQSRGIEANATPRAIRGKTRKGKRMGVYFAEKQGRSVVLKAKVEEIKKEILGGQTVTKPWETKIIERRKNVNQIMEEMTQVFSAIGDKPLADALTKFSKEFPTLSTERHEIKNRLLISIKEQREAKIESQRKEGKER